MAAIDDPSAHAAFRSRRLYVAWITWGLSSALVVISLVLGVFIWWSRYDFEHHATTAPATVVRSGPTKAHPFDDYTTLRWMTTSGQQQVVTMRDTLLRKVGSQLVVHYDKRFTNHVYIGAHGAPFGFAPIAPLFIDVILIPVLFVATIEATRTVRTVHRILTGGEWQTAAAEMWSFGVIDRRPLLLVQFEDGPIRVMKSETRFHSRRFGPRQAIGTEVQAVGDPTSRLLVRPAGANWFEVFKPASFIDVRAVRNASASGKYAGKLISSFRSDSDPKNERHGTIVAAGSSPAMTKTVIRGALIPRLIGCWMLVIVAFGLGVVTIESGFIAGLALLAFWATPGAFWAARLMRVAVIVAPEQVVIRNRMRTIKVKTTEITSISFEKRSTPWYMRMSGAFDTWTGVMRSESSGAEMAFDAAESVKFGLYGNMFSGSKRSAEARVDKIRAALGLL